MAFEPTQFGKYTLYEKLAVGGMAIIYRARIQGVKGFQKDLVIKQILPQYSGMNDFIDMFIDEAKIAVNLNHANIVPVYELGETDGQLYIAMEYVAGKDLQSILEACEEKKIVVPPRIAAYILTGVCRGLDYAHNKKDEATRQPLNIVHRDISPNNVIVSSEGEVKIIDFGIAKASIKVSVTQFGTLKGKMVYMSPEQAAEGKLDPRSDIFSAGILLYELVTGKKPYGGDNFAVTQENVKKAVFTPPDKVNGKLPPALSQIILKAMARDPADRYQGAFDFERALTDFLFSTGQNVYARDVSQFLSELFSEGPVTGAEAAGPSPAKVPTISNILNLNRGGGSLTPVSAEHAAVPSITDASGMPVPAEPPREGGSLVDMPDEGPAIEDSSFTTGSGAAAATTAEEPAQQAVAMMGGEPFTFEIPPAPEALQKPESQRDTVVTKLPTNRTAVPVAPSEVPTPVPLPSGKDGVVPVAARSGEPTRTSPSSPQRSMPPWLDVSTNSRLPEQPQASSQQGVVPTVEVDEETAPGAIGTVTPPPIPRVAPGPRRPSALTPKSTPIGVEPAAPSTAPTPPSRTRAPSPTASGSVPAAGRGPAVPPASPSGLRRAPPQPAAPPPSAARPPAPPPPAPPWASPTPPPSAPPADPGKPGGIGGLFNRIAGRKGPAAAAAAEVTVLEGTYDSPQDFLTNSYATYGDRRGLFLTTTQLDTKLGVDIPLDIQFRSPPATFRVHGRVIWRRAKEGTSKGKRLPAGLAIEFVEGLDDDLEALFAYLGLP